jgi:cytochrome b6-f complex subunit 5
VKAIEVCDSESVHTWHNPIDSRYLDRERIACTNSPKPDTLEEIILINYGVSLVVEPLLSGIVLGLVFITLSGLFVAAYMQYKRGNQIGL